MQIYKKFYILRLYYRYIFAKDGIFNIIFPYKVFAKRKQGLETCFLPIISQPFYFLTLRHFHQDSHIASVRYSVTVLQFKSKQCKSQNQTLYLYIIYIDIEPILWCVIINF